MTASTIRRTPLQHQPHERKRHLLPQDHPVGSDPGLHRQRGHLLLDLERPDRVRRPSRSAPGAATSTLTESTLPLNGLITCDSQRWPTCSPGSRSSGPKHVLHHAPRLVVETSNRLVQDLQRAPAETISMVFPLSWPFTSDHLVAKLSRLDVEVEIVQVARRIDVISAIDLQPDARPGSRTASRWSRPPASNVDAGSSSRTSHRPGATKP